VRAANLAAHPELAYPVETPSRRLCDAAWFSSNSQNRLTVCRIGGRRRTTGSAHQGRSSCRLDLLFDAAFGRARSSAAHRTPPRPGAAFAIAPHLPDAVISAIEEVLSLARSP
jgi:hypothetical protein